MRSEARALRRAAKHLRVALGLRLHGSVGGAYDIGFKCLRSSREALPSLRHGLRRVFR